MPILYPPTYKSFYDKLSHLTGMSNEEIDIFILRMIKTLTNDLHRGGKAHLPYLGKFSLKRMPPRKRIFNDLITNKRTVLYLPAQDKLKFTINKKFSKLFI